MTTEGPLRLRIMKVMVARFSKKHPKQEYVLDAFDKLKALAQ